MRYFYNEAERLIKDIFWAETHDGANSLDIPKVIEDKLIRDNQEKDPEYYNHRPGVVHVSSLSKCLRGVVYEMLGAEKDNPIDARKLGVFKAGNLFEDYIVDSLGELMQDRQTEYVYRFNEHVVLTGRDDGTILHNGTRRVLECKSVHSDSFWHRQKEGTLVAYQNQMQIQTYLWLRRILPNVFVTADGKETIYTNMDADGLWEYRGSRESDVLYQTDKPDNSNLNGVFAYISKDDCTTIQAPVKFNQRIIDSVVYPALFVIAEAYVGKDPSLAPVPSLSTFNVSRGQWTKNWLCTYCDYHCKCAGSGWVVEAQNEVSRLNKEQTKSMVNPYAEKKKVSIEPVSGL